MSRIPLSDIQWEVEECELGWPTSIQVSEPTALKTATVESTEWACIMGIEPYKDMVESARYSNTSALYRRYGSS